MAVRELIRFSSLPKQMSGLTVPKAVQQSCDTGSEDAFRFWRKCCRVAAGIYEFMSKSSLNPANEGLSFGDWEEPTTGKPAVRRFAL